MTKIAAFISGHGFGHAARSVNILRQLLVNGCQLTIITSVPEWFFADKIADWNTAACTYINYPVDVGLAQTSGIASDYRQTIRNLHEHWDKIGEKVDDLSWQLSGDLPDAVYFDIPALAPLVASRLQIPSIAMSNFSWDWIYDDLIHHDCDYSQHKIENEVKEEFIHFRDLHREAYSNTSLLLKLPYAGSFTAFQCPQIDIPWITSTLDNTRSLTLHKLGIPVGKKVALYSFGGHDLPDLQFDKWNLPPDWCVLIIGYALKQTNPELYTFLNADITAKGVDYTEVVKAADIVVTKPGYGIIADCIAGQTPMLHVERGQFAEYPLLLNALDDTLPHRKITFSEVKKAEIFSTADQLIATAEFPRTDTFGAQKAAQLIIEAAESAALNL